MYKLTLSDGKIFVGKSKKDIIRRMRNSWWGTELTKKEYKTEASKRIFELYGKLIDKSQFIDSLVEHHLATFEKIERN